MRRLYPETGDEEERSIGGAIHIRSAGAAGKVRGLNLLGIAAMIGDAAVEGGEAILEIFKSTQFLSDSMAHTMGMDEDLINVIEGMPWSYWPEDMFGDKWQSMISGRAEALTWPQIAMFGYCILFMPTILKTTGKAAVFLGKSASGIMSTVKQGMYRNTVKEKLDDNHDAILGLDSLQGVISKILQDTDVVADVDSKLKGLANAIKYNNKSFID